MRRPQDRTRVVVPRVRSAAAWLAAFLSGLMIAAVAALAATQQTTVSSQTVSSPMLVNLGRSVCGTSLLLTINGTLTATVQVTGDASPTNDATGNWNDLDSMSGLTSSANGNLAYPVTAVRLNVSAWTSGKAVLTMVQNDNCPRQVGP